MQQKETIKNIFPLNFNHERLKLVDAIAQLQNEINNLKEDLLRYSHKTNASEKYIFFKKQQIKVLESVLTAISDNIDINNQIFDSNQKEIANLKIEIFKLQGVCMYHGISNFNSYLRMKTNALISTVKRAYNEGFRQTPFELIENYSIREKNQMQISHLTMMAKQLNINGK